MRQRLLLLVGVVVIALAMLGLYFVSQRDYLLFHSIAEQVGIVVAVGVLLAARYSFVKEESGYPEFLGIALCSVAIILFVHVLAYKGMGVFPGDGANLPTQLWIISRYILAASLLAAPFFTRRRSPTVAVATAYVVITTIALASVFWWRVFPDAYVDGIGLTGFKIVSEYVCVAILCLAALHTYRERAAIDLRALRLLLAAIGMFATSSLAFTLYTDVYGVSNAVGHYFQIAAFAAVFLAVVQVGITWPVASLYRELQEQEDGLRRTNRDLIAVSHSKDMFLTNMTHELRTPLNSIIGFTELLLKGLPGELNAEQRRQLQMVDKAGHHLLSLVDDILDLGRMSAESREVDLSDVDLNDTLEQVVALMRPAAQEKGLTLELVVDAGIPTMHTDSRALQQVVLNLLSNAIKFTDEGAVEATAGLRGDWVVIAVKDTGCGIPSEDLPTLFDDFVRAEQAADKEGTGLGLAVSSRLARLLGGGIDVVSKVGSGSMFTLALPLQTPDSNAIKVTSKRKDMADLDRSGMVVRADIGVVPASLPTARSAMLLLNPQTCAIEDASEGASRLYGWSREKLAHMRLPDLDFIDDETRRRTVKEVVAGQASQVVVRHRVQSGESMIVEMLMTPVRQGRRTVVLAIVERLPEPTEGE